MSRFTDSDLHFHAQWRAASGHPGGWRVLRQFFWAGCDSMLHEYKTKTGLPRLYKSRESAMRVASKLNALCAFVP